MRVSSCGDQERRAVRRLLLHVNVVHPFKGRLTGVDLKDDLVAEADGFGDDPAGGGQGQTTVFSDSGNFENTDIVTAVFGVEAVADILGKVTEVLVTHADLAGVNALGDILAGLVRPATIDHVEGCPTVFSLGTDGGSDEEVELQLDPAGCWLRRGRPTQWVPLWDNRPG